MELSLKKQRLLTVALFIAACILIGVYSTVVYSGVVTHLDDAVRINLVGRERMLILKIMKNILHVRAGTPRGETVEESLRQFTDSMHAVINGGLVDRRFTDGEERVILPIDDPVIRRQLTAITEKWKPFTANARRYLDSRDAGSLDYLLRNNDILVADLDLAVLSLQRRAENSRIYIGIITACGVVLVVGMTVFAFLRQMRSLRRARARLTELERLLPICSNCKKIRVDNEKPEDPRSWVSIEFYLHRHNAMDFTHGICPDCVLKLYPEMFPKK